MYSSLDLSRGQLEEKGETEEKKSESSLTVDSLSWTPEFTEMYAPQYPFCYTSTLINDHLLFSHTFWFTIHSVLITITLAMRNPISQYKLVCFGCLFSEGG